MLEGPKDPHLKDPPIKQLWDWSPHDDQIKMLITPFYIHPQAVKDVSLRC